MGERPNQFFLKFVPPRLVSNLDATEGEFLAEHSGNTLLERAALGTYQSILLLPMPFSRSWLETRVMDILAPKESSAQIFPEYAEILVR
jgi:hypothetical protein